MSFELSSTMESLPTLLADTAAAAIADVVVTRYVHKIRIEAALGVFNCDCSGFVSFLVGQIAARHLQLIAASISDERPLAHDYYNFAAALPDVVQDGWQGIKTLQAVQRGDIVAWKLPQTPAGGDTGHVFIAAAPAVFVPANASWSIDVYDSSDVLHFDDSRGPGKRFKDGIGTGAIHFQIDNAGRPTAFQFDASGTFQKEPIAIARVAPFSSGP